VTGSWPASLAGFRLEHHVRVGSTQDRARAIAAEGVARGVVVADVQTGGRGRQGRQWQSPAGNLYASALLARTFPPALTPCFSLVAAVALVQAIETTVGRPLPLALKWPNDALLDGRKLAGLLLEATEGHLLVGLGLNVQIAPPEAATLESAVGEVDVTALTARWLAGLDAGVRDLERDGFGTWRAAWLARAAWLDEPVRVVLPDRVVTGRHRGIDDHGALRVETPGGLETIFAGDVEQVRLGETI
jgi:BirA family biotin operon repressor/biotin-[acetyl-CoA-carboxylase] ligase